MQRTTLQCATCGVFVLDRLEHGPGIEASGDEMTEIPFYVDHAPPDQRLSFWLKIDRARHHFDEIARMVSEYERLRPYRAVPIQHAKKGRRTLRWKLEISERPDSMLAMAVGDAVHNLRSALDHLVIALGAEDRHKAGFPIEDTDPWALRPDGTFVAKAHLRGRFDQALKGCSLEAQAAIKALQPYQPGSNARYPSPGGFIAHGLSDVDHPLAMLRRLDNADKHRQLTVIGAGVGGVAATYYQGRRRELFVGRLVEDGATLVEFDTGGFDITHSDVEVNLDDIAPVVTVKVGGQPAVTLMQGLLDLETTVWTICARLCRFASAA